MKRVLALCSLLLLSCHAQRPSSPAAALPWMDDWSAASAQRGGRPMIVEFSTQWCPYCLYLDEKIFGQPEVAARMERFVLLRLDGDRPDVQPLMDRWRIVGFPTFLILGDGDRELVRFNDINAAEELIRILDDVDLTGKGHRELREAAALAVAGEEGRARALFQRAADLLREANDPAEEEALAGLIDLSPGDVESAVRAGRRLIEAFPSSPFIPLSLQKLSGLFSSPAIKETFLLRAAARVEEMLSSADKLDARSRRILLDRLIDVLAEARLGLKRYADAREAYLHGARLGEGMIEQGGGVAASRHLIGAVASYYLNAQEPGRALKFLGRAEKALPAYWPVFSNRAKALAAKRAYGEAAAAAERAYGLAEEVAKPKVALLWGEIAVASGDATGALAILKRAETDLRETGAHASGRAAKMLSQLTARMKEYDSIRFPPSSS